MKFAALKLDKLITALRWPVAIFGGIYLVCMIAAPWIIGDWSWSYVQDVWDRWQGVNVGILAFAASFVAFEATRYKEGQQRRRDFMAARAFLPASLSELCGYFKESAAVYIKAWDDAPTRGAAAPQLPQLPSSYKTVFAENIKHAEPEVGEFLSAMLSELQVHDARLRELIANYRPIRFTILSYLLAIGLLQTRVNKLFPFARGDEGFDSTPISWDEFHNAYRNLDIWVEDYELELREEKKKIDLITFTQRWIARRTGEKEPEYANQ